MNTAQQAVITFLKVPILLNLSKRPPEDVVFVLELELELVFEEYGELDFWKVGPVLDRTRIRIRTRSTIIIKTRGI